MLPSNLRSTKFHQSFTRIVATTIAVSGAFVILCPLLWMISTSLKSEQNVLSIPPKLLPTEPAVVNINGKDHAIYEVVQDNQRRLLAEVALDSSGGDFIDPDDNMKIYRIEAGNYRVHETVRIHWENYFTAWNYSAIPFGRFLANTALYSIFAALAEVTSCAAVAYAFARLHAPGKTILFGVVLATIMIPPEITVIPSFLLFTRYIPGALSRLLGFEISFVDTWWPLVLPKFFGEPFLIFLLRQYFMTIPKDYDDAAKMDGCRHFDIWIRIIIPMSKPALLVAGIISFQYHWAQQYMEPLIYLNSTAKLPLTVGLARFESAYGGTPWHLVMAASVISILPLAILFFILNRQFIQGAVVHGIKA